MANKNSIEVVLSAITAGFEQRLRAATDSVKGLGAAAQQAEKSGFDSLGRKLGGLFAGVSAGLAIKELISLGDAYTRLDGRLALVTTSTGELNKVHDQLYEVAKRSRVSFEDTADVFNRFAQATKGTGMATGELAGMTETLNKAFVISGASNQEARAAMVQLSQGFSAGVLRGEEFNAVIEQGGRVIDMLTDYLKVDRGELRAMAEEGKLTTDILRNSIAKGAAKVNEEFAKMPITVEAASTVLGVVFGDIVNDANKSSGSTKGIADAVLDLAAEIEKNKSNIISLFSGIATAASWGIQRILNLVGAVKGMSAVAAGALSVSDFAGMGPDEFRKWDAEFDSGLSAVKLKFTNAQKELKALREANIPDEAALTAKTVEVEGLNKEMSALESAIAKAKEVGPVAGQLSGDVVSRSKLTAQELKALTKDLLVLSEGKKKFDQQLRDIAMAEKAMQFSPNADENANMATTARKEASRAWGELQKKQKEIETGAKAAKMAAKSAEAAARKEEQAAIRAGHTQAKIDAERLRATSEQKILELEMERIEASKLPTELERAEAELDIARRVMAEKIALKKQEIEVVKTDPKATQAEVLKAEREGYALEVESVREEHANMSRVVRENLAETEDAWRRGTVSVEDYRAAVVAAQQEGVLLASEMDDRLTASGNDLGAALALGFSNARLRMQTDAEMMISIGEQLGDRLADGLSSAWDSFVDGTKTAKEALIDFARSTISWLSQVILKQVIMDSLFGDKGSAGNITGGLIGMLGSFSEGGPVQAFASGGAVGGWSPSATADNIPAWLTAREFVQPVRAVDYYGLAFMERIRRLQFPKNIAHALAGGTVPRIPSGYRLAQGGMAAGQPTTVKGGDTKLKVINVLDKNMVGDYMRTASGETALINMIRRNGTAIKTILR